MPSCSPNLILAIAVLCAFQAHAQTQTQKVCEDLHAEACLDANGKNKFKDKAENEKEKALGLIKEARDKTARELGYKDFDDGLQARFKQAGFEIKKNADAKQMKFLRGEGSFKDSIDTEELFDSVAECKKDNKNIDGIRYRTFDELEEKQIARADVEKFSSKFRPKVVKTYALDLPNFVTDYLGNNCDILKNDRDEQYKKSSPKLVETCANFDSVSKEAVQIYRLEGTPAYKAASERFVQKYLDARIHYGTQTNFISDGSASSKAYVAESKKLSASLNSTAELCTTYSNSLKVAAKKIAEDFQKEINTSKTTVDTLIGRIYSDENKKLAAQAMVDTKAEVNAIVSGFVMDPAKRTKIMNGYDSTEFKWLEKIPDANYKKGLRGNLILDEDKMVPNSYMKAGSEGFGVLSDPSLSYFYELNATYMPKVKYGEIDFKERVELMPVFLQGLKENQHSFRSALAHELGHRIGPRISRVNGFDLTPEYKNLVACLKSDKSINLKNNQADETIADYVAAEVMARQIAGLPKEKRLAAAIDSVSVYCKFQSEKIRMHTLYCNNDHPNEILRISGIFGANPSFRKVMGCSAESPKYKSCGIEKLMISDTAISGSGSGGKSGPTEKAKQ